MSLAAADLTRNSRQRSPQTQHTKLLLEPDHSGLLKRQLATTLPRAEHIDWPDSLPKSRATIDNFDEKTEKPLEPTTNLQTRELLRFTLRLEPSIFASEKSEQCKPAASNQVPRLAGAKSDIVTEEIRITPLPNFAQEITSPKLDLESRPATRTPLTVCENSPRTDHISNGLCTSEI